MASQPVLKVRSLCLEREGNRLLNDIDLTIDNPGMTVILGPNGAGKSLLLKSIHGLLPVSRGEIRWAGEKVSTETRKNQSMVFQRPVLLRRSVSANLRYVLKLRSKDTPRRCNELLREVGLADLSSRAARSLSGGEQQRLSLARALASDPDVLLMDEATANLDPSSVAVIERIVHDVHTRGVKVFVVTHDLAQARRLADDVIFMHQGRVLEHAAADVFFDNPRTSQARGFLDGQLVID